MIFIRQNLQETSACVSTIKSTAAGYLTSCFYYALQLKYFAQETEKLAMKYLFMFLFMSYSLWAQTTSSCCPFEDKVDDVIKEDHVAVSCLICNKIELNSFENLTEYASPNVTADQVDADLEALKNCHQLQSKMIQDIYSVIKEFRIISKDKNINHLSQVINGAMLLVGAQIAEQLKHIDAEGLVKLGECAGKDMTDKEIISAQLKVILEKLSSIKSDYKKMPYQCISYYSTSEEEKLIQLIDELETINEASNEN
jgi:hypothetical protein